MNFKPTTDGQIRYLHVLKKIQPERYAIVMAGRTPEDFRSEDGRDTSAAIDAIKGEKPLPSTATWPPEPTPEPVQNTPLWGGEPEPNLKLVEDDPIFRENCTRRLIEDSLRANGISEKATIAQFAPHVGDPNYADGKLVFRRNPSQNEKQAGMRNRIPLPKDDVEAKTTGQMHRQTQQQRFEYAVNEVAAILRGEKQATGKDVAKPVKPVPTITPQPNGGLPRECEEYLQRIWKARDHIRRINESSPAGQAQIPEVGTRALVNGAHAWKRGFPFVASFSNLAMDWTPEISRALMVESFDPTTLTMPAELTMPEAYEIHKVDVGYHKAMGTIVRLAHARRPIALIGPAGCGKTEAAKQLAEILKLEFSMLPMSGGVTRGDICGTETMSGFKGRPFPKLLAEGGVFLADEFDRAIAKVLPILNSALANSVWKNPMTGDDPITKHENFVFVAAMNTTGRGSDRQYTAAEKLDQATLDRFAIGRVKMDFDRDLERRIFEAICTA